MTITKTAPHIVLVEDSDDDFDTVLEAVRLSGLPANLRLTTSGTDGRTTLRRIKADPPLKAVPAVVVTTSASPRDVDCCYQCGANAQHVKPVSYPEYLQMLTELLTYWLVKVLRPTAQRLTP